MFNGVWPASVSSGNCQDHERPEGHDDPDACMYMHGLDVFIYLFIFSSSTIARLLQTSCLNFVSLPEPVPLRM